MYILADGSVDTYLSLHEEDLVLDNIKTPGSILAQYSVIMQKNIGYSARATSETNMLVISIDTINKIRADYYELNMRIKNLIKTLTENGMPMLDYIKVAKKVQINALLGRNEFNGRKAFSEVFMKWRKIFKYSRKKEFKFSNLVKFMKNSQVSEAEQKKAQAKELLITIRPLLQQKVQKLLTTRLDKLLNTVQN